MVLEKIFSFFTKEGDKKEKKQVCRGKDDYELKQGEEYLSDKSNMVHSLERNLKLIENFTNMQINESNLKAPLKQQQKESASKLDKLEKEFNDTLNQYEATYNDYSLQIDKDLQTMNDPTKKENYYGKNIQLNDGSHYYVTKGGFAKPYDIGKDNVWEGRSKSCQTNPVVLDKRIDELGLSISGPMTKEQQCGFEGKSLKNDNSVGFVNNKANIQYYANDQLKDSYPCGSDILQVSKQTFDSFKREADITSVDMCPAGEVVSNNVYKKKLVSLNQKLMSLANEMYGEINTLRDQEGKVQGELDSSRADMEQKLQGLTALFNKMKTIEHDDITMEIMREDAVSDAATYKLRYIAMLLGTVLLSLYVIYHLRK